MKSRRQTKQRERCENVARHKCINIHATMSIISKICLPRDQEVMPMPSLRFIYFAHFYLLGIFGLRYRFRSVWVW